uniref:Uncharacterized protein n=1 Tax=Rhizophora mucronata TaxID=61149 RepID=A0A2P2NAS6_RHIMU
MVKLEVLHTQRHPNLEGVPL